MISLSGVTMQFGTQLLFENVDWRLAPDTHYGLVGANGSGKSTLIGLLSGELKPEGGRISRSNGLRLGLLPQDHSHFDDQPLLDVVLQAKPALWKALQEKSRLMAPGDGTSQTQPPDGFRPDPESAETGLRLAELESVIADADGYAAEAQAGALLEGLGIPSIRHRRNMRELSGGYRMRVLLAQTLFQEAELLLLDEPTNHLDIVSIRWLEGYLRSYPGSIVLVSHDRHFLDAVCRWIADLDYQELTLYKGNYEDFSNAKVLAGQQRAADTERLQKKIAETQQFIDRFRAKATKARQANSRAKQVERLAKQIPRVKIGSRRRPGFRFEPMRASGQEVLELRGVCKSFHDQPVLNDLSFQMRRGEKLAVVGPNGIGKSTLLKIIAGHLKHDAGQVEPGYNVRLGYFGQEHESLLEGNYSLISWLQHAAPGTDQPTIRSTLGRTLFSGDDAEKKTAVLSGGESARLQLAGLMLRRDNLLVLDEPTNHLDLEGREALLESLQAFSGTLIFVSHDRHFVSSLAGRVLALMPEGCEDFHGTYEEYLEREGDDYLAGDRPTRLPETVPAKTGEGSGYQTRKAAKRDAARLVKRVSNLETEIHILERKLADMETLFARPDYYEQTSWEAMAEAERERDACRAELAAKMTDWEGTSEALASLGHSNAASR